MLDRSVSTRSTRATATAKRNRVGPRASAPRAAARPIGRARANFLQRPHAILVEWPRPSQRAHMTVRVSGDRELGNDGSGRRVDRSQRMGALVSVRPDHDHVPPPLQRERHRRDGSPVDRPPVKARCQAPIKSRARCSVGGRLQTSFRSDVRRDTLESARRRPRANRSSRTDRRTDRDNDTDDTFGWRGLAASRLGAGPSARREHCWRHRLFDLSRVPDDLNRLGWAVVLRTATSQ